MVSEHAPPQVRAERRLWLSAGSIPGTSTDLAIVVSAGAQVKGLDADLGFSVYKIKARKTPKIIERRAAISGPGESSTALVGQVQTAGTGYRRPADV